MYQDSALKMYTLGIFVMTNHVQNSELSYSMQ